MLIGAVGAILLGLLYILRAFGPIEAEVVTWGRVSLYTGATLVFLSVGIGRSNKGIAKVALLLGYILLALLQVVPIYLWLQFHGLGISDGTPSSAFVAHWSCALPHLTLLIVSIIALYHICRSKSQATG